jgi:Domain of unknown function (DUF1918)
MEAKTGDQIVVETERTGQAPRHGEVVEVIESAGSLSYRVKWDDGHLSTLLPSAGAIRVVPKH